MRRKTIREWTYEDVRAALEAALGLPIAGIKLNGNSGYLVQECPKDEQPASAQEEEAKP